MSISRWATSIAVAGIFAVIGKPGGLGIVVAQVPPDAANDMNKGLPPEVQEKMDLTDAQVKGFFDAADELRAAGASAAGSKQAGSPTQFAKAFATSEEAVAIIKKHGFKDTTEFQRVGFNAAMAYGVLKQGGKEAANARIEKAQARQKETLDRLKAQLKPEQYKLLEAQISSSLKTAKSMQDVPEGNVEVMKKYQDRMENLGNK